MQPDSHAGDLIFLGIVFLFAGIIYIIPSIVAFRRDHPNRWIILVINVAFGGTIIGWGIALVWAMRAAQRVGSTSSGGESGLNLFVNDVKKVHVVEPPPLPQSSIAQELERLHGLLTRGAISQGEFDDLKARLLGDATT
ncbi:immunity protein, putative [Nitrobacter sp. Nb-311A]|uniref:superinfection immunity protein n=1 Tax=Nitrobacter sp. Nb-311A TaxID=314253 RepID=UPI0000686423|nr:superinfection immunity protein [Nitrobacter sp. Nb-311A]EAQ37511.1 immunity protein, putative [Nitrobacter sp. Nb-311A]